MKRMNDTLIWQVTNTAHGCIGMKLKQLEWVLTDQLQKCWDTHFKSLLVTLLCDVILTFLLPSIQSCSSKFWAWSCIASKMGDHKHKIMAGLVKTKYGAVSQAVLQLVVASLFFAGRSVPIIFASFRGVQNLQNFGLRLFFLIRKHIIVEHFLNDFHLIFAEIRDASLTSLLLLWLMQSSKYDEQTLIWKIEKILKNSNKH